MRNVRFAAATVIAWFAVCTAASAATPHTVVPGDTLWSIATANGVSPDEVLLTGTALKLPSGVAGTQAVASGVQPVHVPVASPSPTPSRLTSSEISSIAASNGVPASLASAIGWQESGFNNGVVSS